MAMSCPAYVCLYSREFSVSKSVFIIIKSIFVISEEVTAIASTAFPISSSELIRQVDRVPFLDRNSIVGISA